MSEPRRVSYGPHRDQFGELYLPETSLHAGTIVIIHGGFWRAGYDLSLGRPLAADLARHGYTCWNVEYRRVGGGGGWPATLDDVAAGIDHLAELDVDTSPVVLVGHSAGGQLAVWAAGRVGARTPIAGVVSQAGVLNLKAAARNGVGRTAVPDLLGGMPDAAHDRYRVADPLAAVPLPVPVFCVHARADDEVPYAQSETYVQAATESGGSAALRAVPGDHYTLIDPAHSSWSIVRVALPALLNGQLPEVG